MAKSLTKTIQDTVHDTVAKLPLDKLDLKSLSKVDVSKFAPVALMVARRSWPLAIALGVGFAAFGLFSKRRQIAEAIGH